MTTETYDVIADGFATAAETAGVEDGITVRGVAIGEDDVSEGLSGKPTRWPGEILEQMEGMLVGKPITLPDPDDPLQHVAIEETPDGFRAKPVPLDAKVGEVVDDRYEPGVGLLFEAEVNHPDAEEFIERGIAEVSPVIGRELRKVPGRDVYEPTQVHGVRDLGLVAEGAIPSNEIKPGSLSAMGAMAVEALSQHFDAFQETSRPDFDGYSTAEWDSPSLEGTFGGDMDAARNSATFVRGDGDTMEDLSLFIVDGEGQLNLNALNSAWQLAPQTDGVGSDRVGTLRSMYEGFAEDAREAGAMPDEMWQDVWRERVEGESSDEANAQGVGELLRQRFSPPDDPGRQKSIKDGARQVDPREHPLAQSILESASSEPVDPENDPVARTLLGTGDDEDEEEDLIDVSRDPIARQALGWDPRPEGDEDDE